MDRQEAVQEFAGSGNGGNLRRLALDARNTEEADDVSLAMGQMMESMDEGNLNATDREQLKHNLFIVSEAVGQLPSGLRIPPVMLVYDNQAIAGSSIYDIYRGTFLNKPVAIKKARAFACKPGSVEHIIKEAKNWRTACEADPHEEYILQLIGVSFPEASFIMISHWTEDRDLLTYISLRGDAVDRRRMVRRIAKGLEILHSNTPLIAHGHLKALNIMINHNGDPLLGDFGLSKVSSDLSC